MKIQNAYRYVGQPVVVVGNRCYAYNPPRQDCPSIVVKDAEGGSILHRVYNRSLSQNILSAKDADLKNVLAAISNPYWVVSNIINPNSTFIMNFSFTFSYSHTSERKMYHYGTLAETTNHSDSSSLFINVTNYQIPSSGIIKDINNNLSSLYMATTASSSRSYRHTTHSIQYDYTSAEETDVSTAYGAVSISATCIQDFLTPPIDACFGMVVSHPVLSHAVSTISDRWYYNGELRGDDSWISDYGTAPVMFYDGDGAFGGNGAAGARYDQLAIYNELTPLSVDGHSGTAPKQESRPNTHSTNNIRLGALNSSHGYSGATSTNYVYDYYGNGITVEEFIGSASLSWLSSGSITIQ